MLPGRRFIKRPQILFYSSDEFHESFVQVTRVENQWRLLCLLIHDGKLHL